MSVTTLIELLKVYQVSQKAPVSEVTSFSLTGIFLGHPEGVEIRLYENDSTD